MDGFETETVERWCIAAAAPDPSSNERAAPSHTMMERGRPDPEHRRRSGGDGAFCGFGRFGGGDVGLRGHVGKVLCEQKVRTEPEDIAVLLTSIGGDYVRVGMA